MNKINFNWGIIGPGRIANKFAESIKVIKNTTLTAIASRSKERGDNFAKLHNVKKVYNTYKDLIADPEINAIYISTPHRFHFEQASLALNAGKPVLCEKPLTVNLKEAKILIKTAKEKNVFLMEAMWSRYLPIYQVVKKWLDEKLIGDIVLLNSSFGFTSVRDNSDRKYNHVLAGGSLLDLGIYSVSISQWVMNENPKTFSANAFLGETNVDELLAVNLQYESGAISQFSCNFLSDNNNDFIIYGKKGSIKIHAKFWGATEATLITKEKVITEERKLKGNGFEYQIEEAMNCIKEGKHESPVMPHNQTLANMELMDNIRKKIGLKYSFE